MRAVETKDGLVLLQDNNELSFAQKRIAETFS